MKNTQKFLIGLVLSGVLMALPQSAHAQYGGQYGSTGQYGSYGSGGNVPSNKIEIDKKVAQANTVFNKGGVQTAVYKDNLSLSDVRYQPGAKAVYKLIVKNTSNTVLKNIAVTDFIPAFEEPMVGPGNFDKNTRQISYVIKQLNPGQSDTQYLEVQIYPQDKLPADKGIVEINNKAQAKAENAFSEDTSKLFVEKQAIAITEVPKTGPELGLAFLALQGVGLAIGLKLRQVNK